MKTVLYFRAFFVLSFYLVVPYSTNACDSYNFQQGPYQIDSDDTDVEANRTLHVPTWTGRLTRKSQNYTELTVQWDKPVDASHLCAYALHYYRGSDVANGVKHLTSYIPSNITEFRMTNLDIGSSYHTYVEAIFDVNVVGANSNVLKSWILVTSTLGFGPDNPCRCMALTTVDANVDNCDVYTGQCQCKDQFTTGQHCDECAFTSYMDPEIGCTACDNCPSDGVAGDGSCRYENEEMHCNCKNGYGGKHCKSCAPGFYEDSDKCSKCNCSGNEKLTVKDICDSKGNCLACDYHTTGNHCELCYPGYIGNAVSRTCVLPSHAAKNLGIFVLSLVVIVLVAILIFMALRRLRRCRMQSQFITATSSKAAPSGSSSSGINFTTLVEEPDIDFQSSSRKLQFMGPSSGSV